MNEVEVKKEYTRDSLTPRVMEFEKMTLIDVREFDSDDYKIEWLPKTKYMVTFNVLANFEFLYNQWSNIFRRIERDDKEIIKMLDEHSAIADSIEAEYAQRKKDLEELSKNANAKKLRELGEEMANLDRLCQTAVKDALSGKYKEYYLRQSFVLLCPWRSITQDVEKIISAHMKSL